MAYGLNGELVNDDRNLTRTTGLDLNGAPTSPIGGLDLNGAPTGPMGLQPINVPDIGFDAARQRIESFTPPTPAPVSEQSRMYYSPSTGEMVVNGFTFNERNATAALASREAAAQPQRQFQLPDTANDWRPLSDQEYSSYIDSIVNPGMGRRVSEAWEHAWRGWGDTNLGAVLAVDPDNEWATNARASLAQEFVDNAPFMLRLQDVQSPGEATEYVAQMVVQGVPWIVDTIAWMAAGAVVGGATSGGVGALPGAVEGFALREAFRRATAETIRQNLRRGAAAYAAAAESRGAASLSRQIVLRDAAQTGVASADDVNRFFDFAERAYHMQRGGRAGAATFSALSNYETGVGEIRNAIADAGGDPTTADSVANIWGMALPYAAVETLGDFILTAPVSRLFPNITQGASRVGNALRQGGLTAASEGAEEGTQYGIVQGAVANATNRPIDIEPYDLLENVIGGALGGAPFGAAAGALGPVTPRDVGITPPAAPVTGGATPAAPSPASPTWEDIEDNRTWAGLNVEDDPNFLFNGEPITSPPPVTPTVAPLRQVYPQPVAPVTDENSPEFRAQYPELSAYLANKPPGYTQSPMDAALNPGGARATPVAAPTQLRSTVAPIITNPDGTKSIDRTGITPATDNAAWEAAVRARRAQPPTPQVGDDQLRGLTEEPTISIPNQNRLDALMGEAKQAVEDGTLNQFTDDKLNQLLQVTKRDLKLHNKFKAEKEARQAAKGGKARKRLKKALKKEDEGRFVSGDMIVTPAKPENYGSPGMISIDTDGSKAAKLTKQEFARAKELEQQLMLDELSTEEYAEYNKLRAKVGMRPTDAEETAFREAEVARTDTEADEDLSIPEAARIRKGIDEAEKQIIKENLDKQTVNENENVQERSTEEVPNGKQAGTGEGTRSPDTPRRETPATSADQKGDEGVSRRVAESIAEQKASDAAYRIERAYNALLSLSKYTLKDPLQTLRGVLRAVEKGQNINLKKNSWVELNGKMLTEEELLEIEKKFPRNERKAPKKNTKYPASPKNEEIVGEEGTATVLPNAPEEKARFVTEDETLEVSWAEGGKIFMPANTYYVYDGTPVRKDIYEATREPVGKSKFGEDGTFRKKEGVVFNVVRARKPGNIKTLESPKNGQNYKAGDLIFTGVAGEQWNQSEAKAAKSYRLEIEPPPFGADLLKIWKDSRADNNGLKAFKEYVLESIPETVAWLETEDAKVRAGLAKAAREVIDSAPKNNPKATAIGSKRTTVDGKTRKGEPLTIVVNPTRDDIMRMTRVPLNGRDRAWEYDTLRYIVGADGTIYVAPGANTLHDDMARILDSRGMMPTGYQFEAAAYDGHGANVKTGTLRRTGETIKTNHPTIFEDGLFAKLENPKATAYGSYQNKSLQRVRNSIKTERQKRLWQLIRSVATQNNRGLTLPVAWRALVVDNSNGEFKDERQVERLTQNLLRTDNEYGAAARKLFRREDVTPKQSTQQVDMTDMSVKDDALSKQELKALINQAQKVVDKSIQFRTTHVFKDIEDFWKNANNVEIIAQNGAKHTLGRYVMRQAALLKLENPQLREFDDHTVATVYVHHYMTARAYVIPGYRAMVAFSDYMGNRRDSLEVLEHEYMVHSGLAAIFPNTAERSLFLHRVHTIPGMEEKRKALIERYERYKNISFLDQIEEVIAFHAMEGPLALEKLLSAPEGIDPATKRTLWEDFKRLVSEWVNKFFNGFKVNEGAALDRIVAGLREYAMTGQTSDLNRAIDEFGAMPEQRIIEIIQGVREDVPKAAALGSATTPEETTQMLYGGSDDPGRPYRPQSWIEQQAEVIKGNADLLTKAKEIQAKGIATPIKEGWKKIGRNLETMINMEARSVLIQKLMEMMRNTIKTARRIMSEIQETRTYATKAEEFASMRKLWGDTAPGSTKKQRDAYNRMAIIATNSKMPLVSEQIVRNAPRLVTRQLNGQFIINKKVFDELVKRGTFTKEEFEAGIPQYTVDKKGNATQVETAKLDKETIDAGYKIYVAETLNMAKSKLKTLEHALIMLGQMNDTAVQRIVYDNKFKPEDQEFVTEMLQHMHKLYADIAFDPNGGKARKKKDKARQVLAELMRTFHEKEKVLDWTDPTRERPKKGKHLRQNDAFKWRNMADDDVQPFASQIQWFLNNDPTTGLNRLERLNSLGVSPERQFKMLGAFQSLINAETQIMEHENSVIQQILGNYVELTRNGNWRVFVDILDAKTGERLHDARTDIFEVLPVIYPKTEREAQALQEKLQKELDGTRKIFNAKDEEIEVKFDVGYGKAPGTRTLAEAPKLKEFLEVADIIGLKLDASQMKQIANLIENAAGRKRLGLQRTGIPGMDIDVLKNNDLTMTRNAWWAAKMSQSWMMDTIFADKKNIEGDWERLSELQKAFDAVNTAKNRNEATVYLAERALLQYANQLRYMSKTTTSRPNVVIRTTKGEQKFKIEPEGQAHLDHAVALRESLERGDLELNLNDLLSKTGPLRMLAVVAQLGSIAAGVMNAFTLITHLPMVLTAHHAQTGYGFGFSTTEVMAEIARSARDVGKFWGNLPDSIKVKELLDKAKAGDNKTGLTIEELEFLYKETLEGLLMPQQTYSLTGGTESSISNLVLRNAAEGLLTPFAATEAANRRISALATYRLAKDRYLKAGVSEAALNDTSSPEYKKLISDIEHVVYLSQGDYANVNRPKAFRGDLAQFVLMYKMFPLMTTLMMYNLPKPQQAAFLGVLFLLGGLKAEPFAEDFMDLYDTLLQKLGFRHDSVELQLTRTLEEIMPGSSGWVMHGFIDNLAFGGTMSSRISMGDILPMTGAFREGADFNREFMQALGPAYSANADALEYAALLADFFLLQQTGIKPATTDWRELIRKMPQAQLRGIGEGALMLADGEITDPRGRLTSDEVTAWAAFSRALGFYPLEATRANTAVRLDRMHIGYMRNIRARYILAYAQAYRQGNREEMDRVVEMVNDWNEGAREAGDDSMLIRNFRSAATRAGRAAASTTIERTSDAAPDYSLIDELAEIMNADTESDE